MSEQKKNRIRPLRVSPTGKDPLEVWVVGINHETAPIELREKLAFPSGELGDLATRIIASTGAEEVVVLSTCNRVEILATGSQKLELAGPLTEFLSGEAAMRTADLNDHRYVYRGRDALKHLFRVASSLDSMVVGESQILGQLKEQFRIAADHDNVGSLLRRCFEHSFRVAKRVRNETEVATKAVSISSAAVDLARRIFDDLSGKTVMLIGAGQMSELAAKHFMGAGVRNLIVTNRSFDRGVELARRFDGTSVPFDRYQEYLPMVDIVLGSVAADGAILEREAIAPVLRGRRGRPMFLIDLGVPRNFDPTINQVDGCYLYDIDSLASVAQDHRAERAKEAAKAEVIIHEESDSFWEMLHGNDITPTIVALRGKLEGIRNSELDRAKTVLRRMDPEDREAMEAMTQAIVNKILHIPFSVLKDLAREQDAGGASEAKDFVHHLFELEMLYEDKSKGG
jgi:glutamyl-tRNA reductase